MLDLVLRKLRDVTTPFRGVLILGTMDHAQFRAINGLPFLLSTHIMTSFILVGLRHSVLAAGDVDFQRLQDLTRMSPDLLKRNEKAWKCKFQKLALKCLTFISSWDDPIINHDVQRMYSRCKPAQDASNEYVEACRIQFSREGKNFVISASDDRYRQDRTRREYTSVRNSTVLGEMNRKLREPTTLLFLRALYLRQP